MGRFHRQGSPPTQYLSLHPLTPWAEVIRNQGLAGEEEAMEIRIAVWAVRVRLAREPARLDFESVGDPAGPAPELDAPSLVADDPEGCRRLADRYREDPAAPDAVRVPSAALPGTENVVVLGARRAVGYQAEPMRPIQLPAALAAVDGRPPRGLFELTRLRGQAHAELEAWRAGRSYELPPLGGGAL